MFATEQVRVVSIFLSADVDNFPPIDHARMDGPTFHVPIFSFCSQRKNERFLSWVVKFCDIRTAFGLAVARCPWDFPGACTWSKSPMNDRSGAVQIYVEAGS